MDLKVANLLISNAKLNGFTCLKQPVYAIIINEQNEILIGSNNINNKIDICPRVLNNSKTGEDYHLCKEICNQNNHAEVDAINRGKDFEYDFKNSTLYLIGHTYCCDNCLKHIKEVGINKIIILN